MARPPAPRLPFADLERLVAARLGVRQLAGGYHGWTDHDLGAVFGISRDAVQAVRKRGSLSLDQADRYAIAAGYHPSEVWPQWWELVEQADAERDERSEAKRRRKNQRERARYAARTAA